MLLKGGITDDRQNNYEQLYMEACKTIEKLEGRIARLTKGDDDADKEKESGPRKTLTAKKRKVPTERERYASNEEIESEDIT